MMVDVISNNLKIIIYFLMGFDVKGANSLLIYNKDYS